MSGKSTERFYHDLPAFDDFTGIADPTRYRRVPDDWVVVITDVIGSTQAIEQGRYKDVNVAGGLAIVALANVFGGLDFPFVFGGDGATFLLPAANLVAALDALAETRSQCRQKFGLELRVGHVPVRDLSNVGQDVLVAKLRVSKAYTQSVFGGPGIDRAEQWIKSPEQTGYLLAPEYQPLGTANFVGLFCPFQDIRGAKDEIISLIVKVISEEPRQQQAVLTEVIAELDKHLGHSAHYHPLADEILIRWDVKQQTQTLCQLNAHASSGWKPRLYWILHKFVHFVTRMTMDPSLVRDADFRKFDGSLKLIAACHRDNKQRLIDYLDAQQAAGRLAYGMHASDKVLVTCLAHFRSNKGVHFVDGADGGYAYAAKQLKQRLAG